MALGALAAPLMGAGAGAAGAGLGSAAFLPSLVKPAMSLLGAGGAGGAPVPAGGGTPFDFITKPGSMPPPPPPPEMNPAFHSLPEMMNMARQQQAGGIGGRGGSSVPPPQKNPAFHNVAGDPTSAAGVIGRGPGMPERNPAFHDTPEMMAMQQQAGGVSRGPGMPQRNSAFRNAGSVMPPPQKNPAFHNVAGDPTSAAGVIGRGPNIGSSTQRPMLASDLMGPGSSHTKTVGGSSGLRVGGNPSLPKGWTTDTIFATEESAGPGADSPGPQSTNMPKIDTSPPSLFGSQEMPTPAPATTTSPTGPVQAAISEAQPMTKPVAPRMFAGLQGQSGAQPNAQQEQPSAGGLFGNLNSGISTLQDKLADSTSNPLFQVGMGLLASGYDGSNPYTAINAGLGNVQNAMIAGLRADQSQQQAVQAQATQDAEENTDALMRQYLMRIGALPDMASMASNEPAAQRAKGRAEVIRR